VRVMIRWETELTAEDHDALSVLLQSAFTRSGPEFEGRSWPLSYARKEARVWLADDTGRPVAHLAVARRIVGVAGADVLVTGVGDVAVAPDQHGRGLGAALMRELDGRLHARFAADFGLVQCGQDVVGFYQRTGWTPISNRSREVDTRDQRTVRENVGVMLARPGLRPLSEWPDGLLDLRGLPW
jgi:predicted N-acetyltransferase YhbS